MSAPRPRLRLIVNPALELADARREYNGALLGHYFDWDAARVRWRIEKARARLAAAQAAVARAQT